MTKGIESEILKKLEEQEKKEGTLPRLLEFYKKLLLIQSEAEQHIGVPELRLSGETIKERIKQGKPLLTFDELELDWSLLRDVFEKVVALFAEYSELFGQLPESIRGLKANNFLARETVKAWFEGAELIVSNDVNKSLLEDIIHVTLSPIVASYSKVLIGQVDQEYWRRRFCPICGGKPDFAFLEKEAGARWLLCSRCNAEWLFQRLECPRCGSTNQNELAYYTDEAGLYRLYVCEKCKRYLKAIDLRKAEPEVLLPLERLMTLDIDAQARKYGYSPCADESAELRECKAG